MLTGVYSSLSFHGLEATSSEAFTCALFCCLEIPKPLDKGFRVAVIASLISGVIIVTMSISFAVCCLRDRMLRGTEHEDGTDEG